MVRKMSFALSLAGATIFSINAATVRGVVENNKTRPDPIAGAVVTLTSTGGGTATEYNDTTDTDGAYRITIDDNGTYAIEVTKEGYTPDPDNDPSVRITNTTSNVVVDLVMIARSSGTIVKGTLTDSLSNAYLVGVKLLLQQSAISGWSTIDSTASVTSGAYTFDSIASGTYRIQASLTGYVTKTISVTVRTDTQTVDIKLVAVEIAKISGTITDSLSNANLNGVKLILQQRTSSGYRTVDSTTSASGAYAFDSVEANTYRIQASLTGYASKTTANFAISGTRSDTMDIKLLATQNGKITGKITGDSANGAAISGATVILERASGTVTAVDTVTTDASGAYLFTEVETGLNYDITASKAGYIEKTIRHSRQSAGTDTVNIVLQKIETGSVYVKVMKQADSAAIAGASVTITATTGTMITGTTSQNGIASFADLATGTYTITISVAEFLPGNRTGYRLSANGKDTLPFYLTAATGGTKVLTGTVTDSASKAAVANVRVALTIQSGGGTFILVDSTDATGKFAISGIPAAVFMGSAAATHVGYRNYATTQVTIGQPNQADTARLNITMVKLNTGIIPHAANKGVAGKPEIRVVGSARLQLHNFNKNGVASLFTMNGKVVYRTKITSNATVLTLPPIVTGGLYIVTVTQKNEVYRQQIIMP